MNYKMIGRVLGMVMLCLAGLMLLPLVVAIIYGEDVTPFATSSLISAFLGLCLVSLKPRQNELYARDGFIAVGLAWLLMSVLGMLPFVLSGDIPSLVDALFESVSGFTTTGATVLRDIESLSRSCMFWRLFSQWIGGMGVLVFMMAVMPMGGEHSMHIMRAEFPGPTVGKLVPRAKQTAKILYLIYVAMTAVEAVLLKLGGLSFYDALVHSFATAGTGGFSTLNASLDGFNSLYVENVAAIFVLLFSINFHLYYCILAGRASTALKNEELHWFICIVVFSVATVTFNLRNYYENILTALRHAFFNVAMCISTSSFNTVDYTKWPEYSKWLLLLLMLIGGCAGSTCGGLKLSRVMVLLKAGFAELQHMSRPRSVRVITVDGKPVKAETLRAICLYFVLYIFIILISTLLIATDGFDTATSFSAALACLSNIGPGLGVNGPTGNYCMFSSQIKLLLCLIMLMGRLELYPILVLFLPSTWRK
jgi:trk system potassium uptake protein TrkH